MLISRSFILAIALIPVFILSACTTSDKKAEKPESSIVKKSQPVKKKENKPRLSKKDRMMRVALKMRGKPYSFRGDTPKGFDASGLVYYAHKQVGLTVPRSFKEQFEKSKPIDKKNIRPGDLVFFSLGTSKPNHVGIYLGAKKFIHSPPTGSKVIISGIRNKKWASILVRGGRL